MFFFLLPPEHKENIARVDPVICSCLVETPDTDRLAHRNRNVSVAGGGVFLALGPDDRACSNVRAQSASIPKCCISISMAKRKIELNDIWYYYTRLVRANAMGCARNPNDVPSEREHVLDEALHPSVVLTTSLWITIHLEAFCYLFMLDGRVCVIWASYAAIGGCLSATQHIFVYTFFPVFVDALLLLRANEWLHAARLWRWMKNTSAATQSPMRAYFRITNTLGILMVSLNSKLRLMIESSLSELSSLSE